MGLFNKRWEQEERHRKESLEILSPVEVEYTNPGDLLAMMMKSNTADSEMGMPSAGKSDVTGTERKEETRRKPIISIHGRDVDEDELSRDAA